MKAPRTLFHIGSLTASTLLASGSTYVLFALYARLAPRETLGQYVAVTAAVALATQLVDGGSGLLMVRDVAQVRADEASAVIAVTAMRRLRTLAWFVPAFLVILAVALHLTAATLAVAAVGLVGAAGYGFVVQALQARQRFRLLAGYQVANAVLFLALGVAVLSVAPVSTASLLAAPAAAFLLLTLASAAFLRQEFTVRRTIGGSRRELWSVRAGSTASALTANVDQLLLGAISPRVTAVYAGSQRAAQGVAAVSVALMNVLLPQLAGSDEGQRRSAVRAAVRLAPVVAAAAAVAGWALAPVLGALYGDRGLAPPVVLALLLAAYSLGAVSSVPVSVLYADRRGGLVAWLTAAQAVLVLSGCVAAGIETSAIGMAAAVAAGKTLYLIAATVACRTSRSAEAEVGVVPPPSTRLPERTIS
ncbi:MAG: lipopolysaccharide biosynthesis protein [Actinomycetales bacterium]